MVQIQPTTGAPDSDIIMASSNTSLLNSSVPSSVSSLSQSAIDTAFHPECQNNTPCLIDQTPSFLGNTADIIPNFNPELLNTTSNSYTFSETIIDNMTQQTENVTNPFVENVTNPFVYSPLDLNTDSQSTNVVSFSEENTFSRPVKSRTRNDSTESVDTIDSSSSSEIFNSAYTDTVSSTTSTAFLIKPTSDSDEDSDFHPESEIVTEACCNEGYMSCSSTEVLNDEGSQEDLISLKKEEEDSSETDLMLPGNVVIAIPTETSIEQELADFVHHSLSPIQENQIVSFIVEEVEPQEYTKITDNIVTVDESFLFSSITNLGDLECGRKRASTMQNIHEKSSFLDLTDVSRIGRICQRALVHLTENTTFGSLASLNTIVPKNIDKDPTQSINLISDGKNEGVIKKSNYTKNLVALTISITLLYIAVGSVRNLQSSINHEGGVGVIALAVNFVSYMIGSIFSSSIVQRFQPRMCIIANLFPNLLYIAANLYPTLWVMIPMSFIQGVSLAIVSNATSTYITFLAKGCSEKTKEMFSQVSGRFFGIFWLIYQSHIIIGNLIASLILEPPKEDSQPNPLASLVNTTAGTNFSLLNSSNGSVISLNQTLDNASHLILCGPNFCQHFDIGGSRFAVHIEVKFLLFGVYIGCIILALITTIFMMEPLNKNLFKSTVSPFQKFKSQMSSLSLFFLNIKFLLMLPLLMYSTMQFAFVSAEFMKGYVTCPLGIHMIGYTMICFGICSSASSYFCGVVSKYIGRIPFIIIAVILNLGSLIYMLQWQPVPGSLTPYFVIMGIWGISDGFWNTQVNSLVGIIFPDKFEEAYSGLRMLQGLSVAIAFGYSSALCMTVKIYITSAVCVIGLVGYLIMEATLRYHRTKPAILLKQTSV